MRTNRVIAFIFARGGSKGLPGKNLKPLAGKPLIAHAIGHAQAVPRIQRVIVSTDSLEIAQVAKAYGAEVPFIRPVELATDTSPEWLSWRHALEFVREEEGTLPSAMVSVPVTAPLRKSEDIENSLDIYTTGQCDAVIAVTDAHRNPYFNMVRENSNKTVSLVMNDDFRVTRRQDAPAIFDVTTAVYVVNPNFVMKRDSLFQGRVKASYIPVERSIDIDTMLDFEIAEYLYLRGLNK